MTQTEDSIDLVQACSQREIAEIVEKLEDLQRRYAWTDGQLAGEVGFTNRSRGGKKLRRVIGGCEPAIETLVTLVNHFEFDAPGLAFQWRRKRDEECRRRDPYMPREFHLLAFYFPLIWENRERILGDPVLRSAGASLSPFFRALFIGGNLTLGDLLNIWSEGKAIGACPDCEGPVYIYQLHRLFSSAPWGGACPRCRRAVGGYDPPAEVDTYALGLAVKAGEQAKDYPKGPTIEELVKQLGGEVDPLVLEHPSGQIVPIRSVGTGMTVCRFDWKDRSLRDLAGNLLLRQDGNNNLWDPYGEHFASWDGRFLTLSDSGNTFHCQEDGEHAYLEQVQIADRDGNVIYEWDYRTLRLPRGGLALYEVDEPVPVWAMMVVGRELL